MESFRLPFYHRINSWKSRYRKHFTTTVNRVHLTCVSTIRDTPCLPGWNRKGIFYFSPGGKRKASGATANSLCILSKDTGFWESRHQDIYLHSKICCQLWLHRDLYTFLFQASWGEETLPGTEVTLWLNTARTGFGSYQALQLLHPCQSWAWLCILESQHQKKQRH